MGECSYFVSSVLVQVRHAFLPDYHLVLSLLKLRGVWVFWNQKKKMFSPKKGGPLNSSVDNLILQQGRGGFKSYLNLYN